MNFQEKNDRQHLFLEKNHRCYNQCEIIAN